MYISGPSGECLGQMPARQSLYFVALLISLYLLSVSTVHIKGQMWFSFGYMAEIFTYCGIHSGLSLSHFNPMTITNKSSRQSLLTTT